MMCTGYVQTMRLLSTKYRATHIVLSFWCRWQTPLFSLVKRGSTLPFSTQVTVQAWVQYSHRRNPIQTGKKKNSLLCTVNNNKIKGEAWLPQAQYEWEYNTIYYPSMSMSRGIDSSTTKGVIFTHLILISPQKRITTYGEQMLSQSQLVCKMNMHEFF